MRLLAASAALLCLGLCGCGSGSLPGTFVCTADVRPAIVVSVTDATTGANIAEGTTVVVRDGDYTETLPVTNFTIGADGVEIPTAFGGARERAGTYTIQVTRAGYAPLTQSNVKVTKGDCHINTQTLAIALTPQEK